MLGRKRYTAARCATFMMGSTFGGEKNSSASSMGCCPESPASTASATSSASRSGAFYHVPYHVEGNRLIVSAFLDESLHE